MSYDLRLACLVNNYWQVQSSTVVTNSYLQEMIMSVQNVLTHSELRRKNVIRLEVVGHASNEGLSWKGPGQDVSHVETRRYMMYLDVSFLQVVLQPLCGGLI